MKFKKRTAVVLAAMMLSCVGANISFADNNEYKAYISGYPD